jgi:hypothetical protein
MELLIGGPFYCFAVKPKNALLRIYENERGFKPGIGRGFLIRDNPRESAVKVGFYNSGDGARFRRFPN